MTVCGFYLLTLLAVLGYQTCSASTTRQPKKKYGSPCSDHEECNVLRGGKSQCVIITAGNKKCLCSDKLYWSGAQCQDINVLKPALTLSNPGQRTVDAAWTANGTSYYTSSYTLTWKSSPGSPGQSHNTSGHSYTIPALGPGTTYTVSISRTITEKTHGIIQNVRGNDQTKTTRALSVFGDLCNNTVLCDVIDSNIQCTQTTKPGTKRCLCEDGRYRPSQSCVKIGPSLSPNFTGSPTLGTNNIRVTWTAPNVNGYTDMYELTISPGGSLVHNTDQETYSFENLEHGTAYNVTLVRTITRYERSQSLPAVYKVYRTKVGYNQSCIPDTVDQCIDTAASCHGGRCRCNEGFYRKDTSCARIDGLKPTSVNVTVDNTTTMTADWSSPNDTAVTGYEVSVTGDDTRINITVGRDNRTTPITGLIPGRQYNVSVKTKITYLQGRDEETTALSAEPKVTTPDTVDGLGNKTNLTAPDITIDFLKADGDVQYYMVQLLGITNGSYQQTRNVSSPVTKTTFNGVVPYYQYNLTITTHSNQQQSTPYTSPIRVRASLSSFDQTILSVRPGGWSVGTNVIPLEICAECLYANGNIVKSGLLVCKVGDCPIRNNIHGTRGDSYDRLPNWHSARGSGFTSMYRATADDWMSGKERDDIVLYTVGGETCEIADQTRFCNGPLLTENSYRVWVFACTNVGCMETLFVEVAVTEAYDVGAVVGGVVGLIVFAVIVFGTVVVYVKVKRKSRSKKNQDSINLGPTQKFDDTYDEVGDGQRMHAITESSSNDGGYVNQASGHSPDGFDSTYEQLATYQNAGIHDYGQINVKTRNKGAKNKR